MKSILTLMLAVLSLTLQPLSAQKTEGTDNFKYHKAVEILDEGGDPRRFIQHRIDKDRGRAGKSGCTSVYIIPPGPKRRTILGGNGVSTSTVVYNELPTYRYTLVCEHAAKSFEVIWYNDAPPIYVGIYDVFQAIAGSLEFN